MTRFFHYTSFDNLENILREGLRFGDVPLTPTGGTNAVWLTTDTDPAHHGLGNPKPMTDMERYSVLAWSGELPKEGTCWKNKREVRITVDLCEDTEPLVHWMAMAKSMMERSWARTMISTGGGRIKARTWWLYLGVIAPSKFTLVEDLRAAS